MRPTTRPARLAVLLVVGLTAYTALVIATDVGRLAHRSLTARVALEVAIVAGMLAAAWLLSVLRARPVPEAVGREAFVAALLVQVVANLAFGVLPAVRGQVPTTGQTFYPWLAGRYVAGVLLLAAAIRLRPRHPRAVVVGGIVAVVVVEVIIRVVQPALPMPPIPLPGEIAEADLHTLLEAGPLLLFAVGAAVAGRNAGRTHEPLERWLALALLVGVFTQVHEALFPAALGQVITSADVLRALSAALLLVGAAEQVTRMQRQRTRALELLQTDLEANQRLLADVRAAKEREEAFSSVVTHELSSPLAAINAQVHVLAALADDRTRPHVTAVQGEAERLAALVRRMDELRSLDGEEFSVLLRPVAIVALLEEIATFTRGLPGGHVVSVDAEDARVLADPVRLGQVLRNLTANATRYAPEGSAIHLRGRRLDEGGYEVLVADEGPGVVLDEPDALFAPYVRGAVGDRQQGLGLGLHVAQRIVTAHGGSIGFVDAAEPGARVAVVLEVAR